MKTLFILLCMLFLNLNAAPPTNYAVVATYTLSSASGIYFQNSTVNITPISAGTTPIDFTQDIYSFATNNRQLELMFQNTPALSDGFGNTIPITYSFTSAGSGTTTSILNNNWIELIANGNPSYRDGIVSPGYITISTGAVSSTQVAGSYSTGPIAIDVALGGIGSTSIGYLTLNVVVGEFIVIGFADTSSYISGIKFIGNDIDFGLMNPGETPTAITRDVYVHTNRDSNIQITFSNTPDLLSDLDGVSTIPVTYSYTLNSISTDIVAGVPFIASNGTNDGTTSVGSITFTPDSLTNNQSSGAYSATVNVVVSAM